MSAQPAVHGHRLMVSAGHDQAGVCAVRKDLGTGVLSAAADPRRPSRAMGW